MAKCSYHGDKEAVEKCTICGKDMCADCAPKFVDERVACPVCVKESIKKDRKQYMLSIPAVILGLLLGIGVIVLLSILIARDNAKEDLLRNVAVLVGVVVVLAGAVFLLVKCYNSFKYYNKRYKIAMEFENTVATTTAPVADKKEGVKATTTAKKAPKAVKATETTTSEAKPEALKAKEQPKTAKKVATKSTAAKKTALKAQEKATTTAKSTAKKPASKATTTAKKEVKPVEKKATTTAKKTSTPAKKAAAKKSTTKK